jgi:hypothetical protein
MFFGLAAPIICRWWPGDVWQRRRLCRVAD